MKTRTTAALALVAIIGIGAGFAVAQQGPPGSGMEHGMRGGGAGRQPPSPEVMERMLDGRIAGTKAALRLTADQEKLWPVVEQAVREIGAKRMAKRTEMMGRRKETNEKGQRPDLIEMLERGSQMTGERSADMKRMADTLKPLYATLSEEQKQVLAMSLRQGRGMRGGGGRHGGMHRG